MSKKQFRAEIARLEGRIDQLTRDLETHRQNSGHYTWQTYPVTTFGTTTNLPVWTVTGDTQISGGSYSD